MIPRLAGDHRERQIIRTHLDESLIVEASAGTGKTTELVNRIVAVLRSGRTEVQRIAAVTFTHKAAGELKVRLRQELDEARQHAEGEEAVNLEDALKHLEEAVIGTIHSFCAQILRERPVEADVDPAFQDLPEQEQRRFFERAFQSWFERALSRESPGLRRALSRLAWEPDSPPAEQLKYAGKKLLEWRDFRAPWRREALDRESELRALIRRGRELATASAQCRKPQDYLFQATAPVREFVTWLDRSGSTDIDVIEGLMLKMARDMKRKDRTGRGEYAPGVRREDVVKAREDLMMAIEGYKLLADADLAALLQSEMQDLLDIYESLKRRAGRLDFVDLLIKTRDVVRHNAAVRRFLQQRYTHLFIDEFQDTDPLQAEMLILLSAGDPEQTDWRQVTPAPGKLFVVGDPKQSIYKFRRADVAFYQSICAQLTERGVRMVRLSTSFRAVHPIQAAVNAAFAPEMENNLEIAQAGYVPLEGNREPVAGQPSVVVVPAPRPWGAQKVTKTRINECLPEALCAWIDWLLRHSGWKVRDSENQWVPLKASHVAVLFRRFVNNREDITRPYVRALEARDIPHLLVGSKSFHQREEVETLRSACTAIEWPDDELSVYSTLRGALFGFSDLTLFRYRFELGRPLNPLVPGPEIPDQGEFGEVRQALDKIAALHRQRNRRPIAETFNELLEHTRAHVGFALRPGGRQVLSNVLRIPELARTFELTGGISFRGFLEELAERAQATEGSEAPMVEATAEGVRLLTVHNAKGLEFPVVVLADPGANLSSRDADRHIDPDRRLCATSLLRCAPWELIDHQQQEKAREEAEGVRVAYVAATRARDLLVLPGVGDEEMEGWLQPLNKAIYPPVPAYRNSRPAEGCPKFGPATVLYRPFQCAEEPSIKPGVVKPQKGGHEVVWWDPGVLDLNVPGKLGLRNYDILAGDDPGSSRRYAEWKQQRLLAIEAASHPEWEILNPSEADPSGDRAKVETVNAALLGERPSGKRFGTLVHMVLRDSGFDGSAVEHLSRIHARTIGATEEESQAAAKAVLTALGHPLIDRARQSRQCFRELPVSLRDGSRMIEGSIDLAFEEAGEWQVVDFKTDAYVAGKAAHYERQLNWYAQSLRRTTGKPVRCWLFSL